MVFKIFFIKLRTILDLLSEITNTLIPADFQAIDEMVVTFKGKRRGRH